jgi:hypothetical protein
MRSDKLQVNFAASAINHLAKKLVSKLLLVTFCMVQNNNHFSHGGMGKMMWSFFKGTHVERLSDR